MPRGPRAAFAIVVMLGALVFGSCSSDGNNDDDGGETPTREQAIDMLLQQGYTQAGAECIIDNAEDQDVDVLDVFTRDQVTQRELQVLATVQQFCIDRFGTTGTTVAAGTPSDTAVDSVPG